MSSKRPARSLIVTDRQEGPESIAFYGCPNPKCPVRWWPVSAGDRCLGKDCGATGVFIGIMTKIPDPQPGADDGDAG